MARAILTRVLFVELGDLLEAVRHRRLLQLLVAVRVTWNTLLRNLGRFEQLLSLDIDMADVTAEAGGLYLIEARAVHRGTLIILVSRIQLLAELLQGRLNLTSVWLVRLLGVQAALPGRELQVREARFTLVHVDSRPRLVSLLQARGRRTVLHLLRLVDALLCLGVRLDSKREPRPRRGAASNRERTRLADAASGSVQPLVGPPDQLVTLRWPRRRLRAVVRRAAQLIGDRHVLLGRAGDVDVRGCCRLLLAATRRDQLRADRRLMAVVVASRLLRCLMVVWRGKCAVGGRHHP